jgi:hypothetical protein
MLLLYLKIIEGDYDKKNRQYLKDTACCKGFICAGQ